MNFNNVILNSIIGSIFLLSLTVRVDAGNPNGIDNKLEPGWSLWRTQSEIQNADFDAGFSNLELGGYLDFEYACKVSTAMPESEIKYWFRLSDRVNRIGTGEVEYGCWLVNRFLHIYTSTAIKRSSNSVDCLRVKSAAGGVLVRSEPTRQSQFIRVISNGKTVKTGYSPATITNQENRSWVRINSPVEGWIYDGSMSSQGNLRLCSLHS